MISLEGCDAKPISIDNKELTEIEKADRLENRLGGENTIPSEGANSSLYIGQEAQDIALRCTDMSHDSSASNSVYCCKQGSTHNHSERQSLTTVPQLIDSVAQCADLPMHIKLAIQALLATIPKDTESPDSSP